jgi:hypothetical protein
VHKNNVRRRRKLESNLAETVRIASIVQKGVESGRSSYVEMRAIARLTCQNVRTKVHLIQTSLQKDDSLNSLLKDLATEISEGYVDVLTPNGIVRDDKLDTLLSLDSEIVICLEIILENGQKEGVDTLRELVEERKKFVSALRA